MFAKCSMLAVAACATPDSCIWPPLVNGGRGRLVAKLLEIREAMLWDSAAPLLWTVQQAHQQ